MFNPGMIIAGRYEIIDVVGSGGMSIVYKAKCHKLNRFVAIKVLKPEFSDDKNFVTKFRVEAQSAAGLSHPNIVNVYDVGEDEGVYFIVMELVEGITLKEYIQVNGRLSVDKAIDFAIQIASGIEVAHDNHTIHRDIKPQNIIVAKNGTVKVTDFGIARAATSNTIGANAMGSVHYISPEQARGGYSDERSDIYSLGITMYEMLTGRVPFEGDNNVTVALMHIQEAIIPPREYYPEIPASLEKIVLKCTQKKPERRYLTANALIADLKRVQANPNVDLIMASAVPTDSHTLVMSDEELKAIKDGAREIEEAQAMDNEPEIQVPQTAAPVSRETQDAIDDLDKLYGDSEDDYEEVEYSDDDLEDNYYDIDSGDDEEVDPKLVRIVSIAGIVVAVFIAIFVMVLIGSFAGWFHLGGDKDTTEEAVTNEIEMIDVLGLTEEKAIKALEKAGFTEDQYKIEYVQSDTIDEGLVVTQSIDEGTMVKEDDVIVLEISSGVEVVEVPNVKGYDDAQAETLLVEAGFVVKHSFDFDEEIEKDKVISQSPEAATKAPKGSTVIITVSNGPEVSEVQVPDLKNKSLTEAEAALSQLGLLLGTTNQEYSDDYESGKVMGQSKSAGSKVKAGDTVDITLSKGKDPATATTEVKKTTYTASFTGQIKSNYTFQEGEVAVVSIIFKQGNVSYELIKGAYTSAQFPIELSSVSQITGLSTNQGSISVSVTINGTDVTGSFSSSAAPSFEKVTE